MNPKTNPRGTEVATLGGGCFWCVEAVYRELQGVSKVASGYAGGDIADPSYEDVCSGETGHAEVVQITYDPTRITYRDILDVFLTVHDPTTKDRQGADVGTQYRSIILTHDAEQERIAKEAIAHVTHEGLYDDPLVTEVTPLTTFYPAEAYHQDYYKRNPMQPYCMAVIRPKLAKFRKKWADRLQVAAKA